MESTSSCKDTYWRASAKIMIIDDDDRILLLIDQDGRTTLPGGGIHHSEKITEAAARELKEETNLTVNAEDIKILGALNSIDDRPIYEKPIPRLNVVCATRYNGGQVSTSADEELESCRYEWVATGKLTNIKWCPSMVGGHKNDDDIKAKLKEALKTFKAQRPA